MSNRGKAAYCIVVVFGIFLILVGNRTQFEDEKLVRLLPGEHSSFDSKDHMRYLDQRASTKFEETERDTIQSALTLMDDVETGETETIRQTIDPMEDSETTKRYTSTSSKNSLEKGKKQCSPLTNVVYIKAHKTGGSTLQNILYRFGDDRNLTFALPVTFVYIGGINKFKPESILPPPPGKQYNILANHARLYYNDMIKLFPPDTKFITLIRESSSHFESMYTYFGQHRTYKVNLEKFSLNPKKYYNMYKDKGGRLNGKDPELYDLGMRRDDLFNNDKIDAYIPFLSSKMDLVLLTEYYLESLILLKDLMCWDLQTLVHLKSKERVYHKGFKPIVDENAIELKKRLTEWNDGDFKLYDHFNRTFWKRVEEYGREKMSAEIEELKDLCQKYQDECMSGTAVRELVHWSHPFGVKEYVLRDDKKQNRTCASLVMNALDYVSYLRKKHKANLHKT